MSTPGFALVGITAFVALLVAVLAFAVLRFATAARAARRQMRGSTGETALLSSALHDAVTTLKAQERAMSARAAASERLGALVFDSLTAGLLVVDADGRVTLVNPAGRRMLGLAEEPGGASYRDLLVNARPLIDLVAEGLSAERPIVRRSIRVEHPNRSWHFGVTVSPLGDPSTRHGAICLFSDLTAVVELEQQLQMKEALARLGELTAGLAHEFRNGLATIHGYSRLIDPQALPAKYQPYVQGIRQETDALGRVVTNFLNFARPESIALAEVDLEAVARRAVEELGVELPKPVALEVVGTFGLVAGDEILLRQTFSNLIRNAAEACEGIERPSVTIEGSVDPEERTASVVVHDNGPGIPEADRTRIFQPFYTTRSRGSGLGLSIVQKIVLLHNGRIAVGAGPAGGARLQLTFPLVDVRERVGANR